MKGKKMLFIGMLVLLLASTLVFTGCGPKDPKVLAKQYVEAEKAGNDAKREAIAKKVKAMPSDSANYMSFMDEYEKLTGHPPK